MNELSDLRPPFELATLRPLLAEPAGTVRQSAWWRHAPFARWVLLTLRPGRAAGEGEAFAAVQALALGAGLATEWSGAAEGPAELLVLDGRWDEDAAPAVRDRWQGQLAPGAAVLIHGINPGQGGSLVWASWLAHDPAAPCFTLSDGAGLGLILHDGARAPAALRALCAFTAENAADFASLCAALGARWTARAQDAATAMTIIELTRGVEGGQRASERLRRRCDALQTELATLRHRDVVQSAQEEAIERLAAELARQTERAETAEHVLFQVTTSTAWRLALIFVRIARRLRPRVRVGARRAGRLLWWLARGRSIAELRRHRRARRRAALLRVSPLFDSAWYRQTYPDVAGSPFDPALHFAIFGAAEDRDGGPGFDAAWYLARNPDVAASGLNPLLHYLEDGVREGREWRARPAPVPARPAEQPDEPSWSRAGSEPLQEEEASPGLPNLVTLGRDLPGFTLLPVVVGFAMRNTPITALQRALDSAGAALDGIGQSRHGSILVADDCAAAEFAPLTSWQVSCLPSRGRPGLAAAHNRLMEAAFSAGAEVYVAAHPGGVFSPDAIMALLRMVRANGRRALVEAVRTPRPVPKPVGAGAVSWSVSWSSGACLAIPRRVYEAIGGFDAALASWGADVDYSWRAKAAGFSLLACPDASFELAFRDEAEPIPPAYLADAILLARKWRLAGAETHFQDLLDDTGEDLPDALPAALPEVTLAVADFGSGPFFGEPIW